MQLVPKASASSAKMGTQIEVIFWLNIADHSGKTPHQSSDDLIYEWNLFGDLSNQQNEQGDRPRKTLESSINQRKVRS